MTASAPSPSTVPQGVSRRAEQRLRVGGGGVRHVAALAVGDHEQARAARVRGDLGRAHPSPGAPRRSKQASWSLTPDAGGRRPRRSARGSARDTARAARSAGVSPAAAFDGAAAAAAPDRDRDPAATWLRRSRDDRVRARSPKRHELTGRGAAATRAAPVARMRARGARTGA